MKILKKILLLTIFGFVFTAAFSKVNAASANISSNKTSMKVGETATITVSYTAAAWNVQVSGAVNYSSADASSDAKNTSKSTSLKFTPKKTGTYTVSLSGDVTDQNGTTIDLSKSITITVKEKTTNNNTNNATNTTNNDNTTASSDATLSNLGIRPNDFSGFRKAITSYSVTVPKATDKITIYATPAKGATVTGTGLKNLQIGKNTFNIKVTAEDKKTTKTYTLTITRKSEDEVSTDATLTDLGIRPKEYDFTGFKPSITSYNVSVPNDVEKVTIYATAKSEKSTITGNGSKTLNVGANKCEIKVTAEDKKTTKTYIINITRKEKEKEKEEEPEEKPDEKENENETTTVDGLKSIEVKDADLSPTFSQNVYSYKVSVPSGTKKLEIDTETTGDNIEVETAGNEDLKSGKNIITILVHNKKDDTTSTYQITANVGNQEIDLTTVNNEFKEAETNARIQSWIIRGTIIAIVVLIIIYLVQRYKLQEDLEDFENEEDYQYDEREQDEETYSNNSSSEDLRNIGLFDETQRIEFDDYNEPRKRGKYKGRRFK